MSKILVIHPAFPGAMPHVFSRWIEQQHDLAVIRTNPGKPFMGARILTANPSRAVDVDSVHPWARGFDHACRAAEACATAAMVLRDKGWVPDAIWAMPSFGDSLLIKQIFPDSPILGFVEWNHGLSSPEFGFDPEHDTGLLSDVGMAGTANAIRLLEQENIDIPYGTTKTALTTFPEHQRRKMRILHEGIPTKFFSKQPREIALETLQAQGCEIPHDAPILTWVSRGQELSRGFHSFMRSIPYFQKELPEAHIIAIGGDGVHYGKPGPDGKSWKEVLLEEVGHDIDHNKIHWIPWSGPKTVRAVYSISDCHLYLTAPIQLSLSPLEAMSCQAPIVTNRLPQTEEFITDGVEGRFVDFFNYQEIAKICAEVILDKDGGATMGIAGRQKILDTVDLATIAMPAWDAALQDLIQIRMQNMISKHT